MDEKNKETIKNISIEQIRKLPRTAIFFLAIISIGLFFIYQLVKILDGPLKYIVVISTLIFAFYFAISMKKTLVDFDALAEVTKKEEKNTIESIDSNELSTD